MHSCCRCLLLAVGACFLLPSTAIPTRPAQVPLGALRAASSALAVMTDASDYSVGFDLTALHGTAAISFSNGTTRAVALVSGDEGYNETFRRLALESSRHLAPPYEHLFDGLMDELRETIRKLRKIIGLPASPDVGHLGRMLEALRNEVTAQTGLEVTSGAVITPHLAALYQEDLRDAFEYIGLNFVTIDQPRPMDWLYEASAAYAGYGFGLCADYRNQTDCQQEERQMNTTNVLSILYTDDILSVDLDYVASAYYIYFPRTREASDFCDGYRARCSREGREAEYWDHVQQRISKELVFWRGEYLPKVILMGTRVDEKEFRRRLERALVARGGVWPEFLSQEAEFVAAKGVAEMAKRQPYRQ